MKLNFKRITAMFLSVLMIVGMFPVSVFADFTLDTAEEYVDAYVPVDVEEDADVELAEETIKSGTWGGIDWTLTENGTLTIAPTTGDPVPDKNAPTKRTYEVGEWRETVVYKSNGSASAIGGAPYVMENVTKLIIQEGVTSIGSFTAQFPNLTGEVVIPSTVTYIGQEAFQKSPMTKLTFAEGGTEELCIAQGAFKNLIIEEVALPADRPVHLHAWVFNNCHNLKRATLPATLVSVHGTNHIDYFDNFNSHSNPTWTKSSEIFAYNENMETITFGSKEVMDMFYANNNGTSKDYTVANVGLTTYFNLEAAAKYAKSGDTITLLKNTDEVVELPAGVIFDTNGFTADNVTIAKPSVAQIGEEGYETLAEALAAANAGDTITFVADITEDVTVTKTVTIDGAGKTYTGKMTLKADTTIKNVNFDGKGYNGYAVETRGANYLTIEDCTAKNYGYGFVQLASATVLTTVKNVTVSNMNYGVKVDYSNAVVLENVDITATAAAVLNSNYGTKTITIKDSALSILGTWDRNDTIKTNYVFEGANTINEFIVVPAIDNFKLAAGATLTAPEGYTVTTVDGYEVKYENGTYTSVEKSNAVVVIGTQGYESLSAAITAAQAGDTITFLADITEDVTVNKTVTIDGAGKTYTGAMNLTNKANIAIKNVNFDGKGYNGYAITTRGAYYLTIEDCTAANYGYGFVQLASATVLTTVKNVTVSNMNYGVKVDYSNAVVLENVDITAAVAAVLNSNYGEKTITIKDSELNILGTWTRNNTIKTNYVFEGANSIDSFVTDAAIDNFKLAAGATLTAPNDITVTTDVEKGKVKYENGVYSVITGLAGSGTEADPYQIGSVDDLIMFRDSVNDGETTYNAPNVYVALTADIDMAGATWERGIGDGINATFDGIFDGKEFAIKNLNFAPKADSDKYFCGGLFGYTYGAAVIKNVTLENITVTAEGEGHNVGALVGFANNNGGKLTVSNVNVKNVTIKAPSTYGVGAIVGYSYRAMGTIENCTVDGATITGHRFVGGITGYSYNNAIIDNCTVNNATITGEIGVGGIAGIALPGNNIDNNTVSATTITAGANWGYVVGEIADNTFTLGANNNAAEPKVGGVWETGKNVEAKIGNTYYATFAAAFEAAKDGDTVTLLADLTLSDILVIDKAITLDGNGNTLTSTAARAINVDGANGVTIENITIKASGERAINVINGATNVTVDNVTATAANYTVNLAGSAANAVVAVNNSNLTGLNVVNVAAEGAVVTIDNTKVVCNDQTDVESYAALSLNQNAVGAKITATSVTFDIKGDSTEASNGAVGGKIYINGEEFGDKVVAVIEYEGTDNYYSFTSLEAAVAAAKAGDTVTILAGDYTTNLNVNKAITVVGKTNAEGKNLVNIEGKVSVSSGATVKNLNVHNDKTGDYDCAIGVNGKGIVIDGVNLTGYNGMRYCYANGDVTIKNSTIDAKYFALHFDGSNGGNLVIDNCDITGWVSYAGTVNKVTLKDSTFDQGSYAGQRSYTKNLVIDGCTFNTGYKLDIATTESNVTVKDSKMSDDSSIVNVFNLDDAVSNTIEVDGTVLSYVAKIGNTYYATLADALADVKDYANIKLVANATLNYGAREAYGRNTTTDIIIDGQGFTLTLNQTNSDWSSLGMKNADGKLTLKNMTIEKTGYGDTNGAWNTHAIIFSCNVDMNNVTVNNGIAVQNGAKLNNVTINEANGYYGLWINGNGQTVTVNGGEINATNGGRGIKIADQYVDAPASVTLSVTGTKFSTAKKAAVLVSSTAGAAITASGFDITKVAEDDVNFVWVDEDWAAYNDKVTVNDGTKKYQEGANEFAAEVNGNYYKTIADAVAAANNGDTIKVVADHELTWDGNTKIDGKYAAYVVVEGKSVTIDLNGKTLTGNTDAMGGTTLFAAFAADNGGEITLTNGTVDVTGDAQAYCLLMAYEPETALTVKDGTYKLANASDSLIYSGGNEVVTIEGGNFTLGNVGNGANGKPWIFNALGSNSNHVIVTGGTFNADVQHQYWAFEVELPKEYALKNNGNGTWTVVPAVAYVVEIISGYENYLGYATFAEAIAAADAGETVTLLKDIALSATTKIDKNVVLDLGGKTITGTDNATASFALIEVQPGKELTINDTVGNGKITLTATNNRGWGAYSSVISNQRGKLTVNGGKIEHLGGTDMAYAIDNLTNTGAQVAETTVNGGTIKSTYRAIRQFLNSSAEGVNNILTVNGGTIEGTNKSIWMQNANSNNNPGTLTVADSAVVKGDIMISGSGIANQWNVSVAVASAAIAEGSAVTLSKAEGYAVVNNNGTYAVVETKVTIGSVEDLLAFAAAVTGNTSYQGIKVAANSNVVVLLTADLDLANSGFAPIGNGAANAFAGTFDGQNHTISNMTLSCNYYRGVGFFRNLADGAIVKNVTFVNANVNNGAATSANHFYGVVAGFAKNLTLEDVNVKDSTVTCKYSGAAMVGCLEGATTIKNSEIDNVTLTTTNIRAAVYGIIGNSASGHTLTVENNTVKNVNLVVNGEIKTLPESVGYGSWNAGSDYAESTYVAKIGDVKYSTLNEAIAKATAGQTITLIGNVELSKFITIGKSITLDLGEFNITRDGGTALYVDGDVEVTINGTTGTVTGHQAIYANNGLVKVNGGFFHASTEAVYVINTGKVEIYGGTFSAEGTPTFVLNEYDKTRETSSITVYGGTFVGFNPADNAAEGAGTNFVADGYEVDYADGKYTVKEVVPAGIITSTGHSISLEGNIWINKYASFEGFEGIDLTKDAGLLIWTSEIAEEDAVYDAEGVIVKEGLILSKTISEGVYEYGQITDGIVAPNYGDKLYMRFYVNVGDHYEYGAFTVYSVEDYCRGRIEKSSNASLKKLCAAVLNYGAQAQIKFNHNTDKLVNANIDSSLLTEFSEDMIIALDTSFTTQITASENIVSNGKSISLDEGITINYYYKANNITVKTAELLTWSGVEGEPTYENATKAEMTYSGVEYGARGELVPAAKCGETIYACARFTDAEGNVYYSAIEAYSAHQYAANQINKGKNVDLLKSLIVYSNLAKVHFDK